MNENENQFEQGRRRLQETQELADSMTPEETSAVEEVMERVRMGKTGYWQELAHLTVHQTRLIAALVKFESCIRVTGGVLRYDSGNVAGCAGDPEWLDLSDAYMLACETLGVEPLVEQVEDDEDDEEYEGDTESILDSVIRGHTVPEITIAEQDGGVYAEAIVMEEGKPLRIVSNHYAPDCEETRKQALLDVQEALEERMAATRWQVAELERSATASIRGRGVESVIIDDLGTFDELPRLNIKCECSLDIPGMPHAGGTTNLPVIRVEAENDGSFTAVTNYWPKHDNGPA